MWDQKADLPQMGQLLSWKLSQGVLLVLEALPHSQPML